MGWLEDFEDVPAAEERSPDGLSSIEMQALHIDGMFRTCERCGDKLLEELLTRTEVAEYYMMDIDPGSMFCADCYEAIRLQHTPSDPALFDGLMPITIT